jgi:hypothetical protein
VDIIIYAIEIRDLRLPRDDEVNFIRVGVDERESPGNLSSVQSAVYISVIVHANGLEVVPVKHPDVVLREEEMLVPVAAEQTF